MAIVKMRFISIIGTNVKGDTDYFDEAVLKYISKYEIQLENTMIELENVKGLTPMGGENPYRDILREAREKATNNIDAPLIPGNEAIEIIKEASEGLKISAALKQSLMEEKEHQLELIAQVKPLVDAGAQFKFSDLFSMEYIKLRYGRLPIDNHKKLTTNMDVDAVFVPGPIMEGNVYGFYFTSLKDEEKVDAIFSSLHFERIRLSDALIGTPGEELLKAQAQLEEINDELESLETKERNFLNSSKERIAAACKSIETYNNVYGARKYAATTSGGEFVNMFILVGWMTEEAAKSLAAELDEDERMSYIFDNPEEPVKSKPPTKLKNFFLFKPFELYIKMYGLPAYNEIDPTSFVALTYAFLFGMMFGDVGQGILLALGGFILYRIKKMDLAAIMSLSGVFSTIFGFVFGSVFGDEEILKPLWTNPLKGETMQVLLVSVSIGAVLIIVTMILNIINSLKQGHKGRALFDTNGISGLVFYTTILTVVIGVFDEKFKISFILAGILIAVSLICIFLREPLEKIVEKRGKALPKTGLGMYFVEAFFELFEILLSFITNTISFIRIGGFALSHAGMMSVVYILAENSAGGHNIAVIIIGNIIVMGIEGLIVGIQSLRLEYYELFSRFYKGGGRDFAPYEIERGNK